MFARGRFAGWAVAVGLGVVWVMAGWPGAWADTPPADSYEGGDGSAGDPYQIATLAQLRRLSETSADWGQHFVLTADIDASDTATWNVGDHDGDGGTPDEAMGFSPIGEESGTPFNGALDGNGHTIAGLFVNRPARSYVGLLGYVRSGSVTALDLVGAEIVGDRCVGGIAGSIRGVIESCSVRGAVSGTDYVGGLAGIVSEATIEWSYAAGSVSGEKSVGGLAGFHQSGGLITSCYATGSVAGGDWTGGLVGSTEGSIESCRATGAVSGAIRVGGLVGWAETTSIVGCYATGSVAGTHVVGGLVGDSGGMVISCYATGAVRGTSSVGGLLGYNGPLGTVTSSCWDMDTSGTAAGIGQDHGGSASATGLTSVEMQQQASFTGWDFAAAWGIVEGETRPYLQEQAVALFEGVPEAMTSTSFTMSEGYVYNVPGSGVNVVEYGFLVHEDGDTVEMTHVVATGQSLAPGNGVALDATMISGLDANTTYLCQAYAVDDTGIVHSGTERSVTTGKYAAGDGTAGAPYEIATLAELRALSETPGDWASHFRLIADIDATDTATWNVGDHDGDGGTPNQAMGFSPIGSPGTHFEGHFDGNGHVISGLYINRPAQSCVGFFGSARSGTVTALVLGGVEVSGDFYVGGLVGYTLSAITSCCVTGPVKGEEFVGGLAGIIEYDSVASCCATGTISGTDCVGGLAGAVWGKGSITSCYATGAVSGRKCIGGLVGFDDQRPITTCYATGAVSGKMCIGGLVGLAYNEDFDDGFRITSCYATGAISGVSDVGGLIGMTSARIEGCYWDTETTGMTQGLGSSTGPSPEVVGLTSAQMTQQAAFPGWDFATTWGVVEGETRPYLSWQAMALFEGAPSVETATGFTVDEGYVYNVPGSGVVVTDYGFALREAGSDAVTLVPVASGQALAEGAGVALDGAQVDGLTEGTTYHYRIYGVDDGGLTHYGTERTATTTHRPTSADGAITTDEDTGYFFVESDFAFADADAGDTFGGVRIASLATAGVVQHRTGTWGAVTLGQEISAADIDAGSLRFRPAVNANGTPYATFAFQVADNRGDYSVASYAMTVNVTPIPDDPVIAQDDPQTMTTEEDTPGTLELTATDGDEDPLTWSIDTPPTNGTAEVEDGTVTYTPAPGFVGGDGFVVEVDDGNGGNDTITVIVSVVTPAGPCDIDCNGVVDAVDVQLVINAALGLTVAYDCDANKDGSIDAVDVQLVINAALGL